MKRLIVIFTTIIALATLFSSCAEEQVKLAKKLDGTWNATSVTIDGEEAFGALITASSYTFADAGEGMGTFTNSLTVEFFGQSVTESINGDFTVTSVDDNDMVMLSYTEDGVAETLNMDMDLDGSDVTFTFVSDSSDYVVKASKQ
ncbi:MAG: hypothetical protein AB8F95_00095 [Bacteroidia bacterium]